MTNKTTNQKYDLACIIQKIAKPLYLALAILASSQILTSSQVMAVELYFTGSYGIDSNPHQLPDIHTIDQEAFVHGDLAFSGDYNETLFFKANAKKAQYSDDERADWFKSDLDLAFKSKFSIKQYDFGYQISADHASYDKTYVNEVTGLVGTFNGQSIADRFDADLMNFNAHLSYETTQNTTFTIRYQQSDKDFEQIDIVGLSDLDFKHDRIGLDIDYQASKEGLFFAEIDFTTRDYLDRRAKDLDGIDVADTDLSYRYYAFKVGYDYRPDESVHWKYTFNYSKRSDNDSGYWDSDTGSVSIYSQYVLADYHIITGNLKLSRYAFENQVESGLVSLDEEDRDREGASLYLDYQWIFATFFKTRIGAYVTLEASAYDSPHPEYIYHRYSASVGVRWTIF